MLRDNLNRQLKYSIRKKKNGGGAASFIVGSVIFGGLMIGNAINANADEVTTPSTSGNAAVNSNKINENKDISGKEVTLSKPNTVGTPANQKEDPSAVGSDNVVNKGGSTENSENPVDPTNEKQTANETTGTKSSDTDVKNDNLTQSPTNARKLAATAATVPESQLANNKITISNFKVNKHVIRESDEVPYNC
ncbi:hypothetical protein [Ligilactobacillus salivarius]|uniref:hypothetical protein n=1 Tax=Ligilactobacillus salivarius TaxID=1624 RepID=UPI00236203CE|nr:hypothetical protein [Ligilactobacillus salivarius]MDD1403691.1 hypothetical protein [Ligilactobacillus salivarius]